MEEGKVWGGGCGQKVEGWEEGRMWEIRVWGGGEGVVRRVRVGRRGGCGRLGCVGRRGGCGQESEGWKRGRVRRRVWDGMQGEGWVWGGE